MYILVFLSLHEGSFMLYLIPFILYFRLPQGLKRFRNSFKVSLKIFKQKHRRGVYQNMDKICDATCDNGMNDKNAITISSF